MASQYRTIAETYKLLKNHRLDDWKVKISKHSENGVGHTRKDALAFAHYQAKLIWFSEAYIAHAKWEDILETIRHEVAHALTPGAGHTKRWKVVATALGCNQAAARHSGLSQIVLKAHREEPKFTKRKKHEAIRNS